MSRLLDVSGIVKHFSGLQVLHRVGIEVAHGERVGLIGPNGAGKTTFFNCILGLLEPDAGSVLFDGKDITREPPHRRARQGIGRTFQRVELFAGMTPRQHLLVSARAHRGGSPLWRDVLGLGGPTADERAETDEVLGALGLSDVADRPVDTLSLGRNRLVELGRAIINRPRLLLLDEPSSGLDRRETDALVRTLHEIRAVRGFAILLVEHDVEMVRNLVARLTVIDVGRIVASGPTAEVLDSDVVKGAYFGEVPA
jgi:branched-chain amino acid transport system ATP-binding protein